MAPVNANGSITRITREIARLNAGGDLSLLVAYRDSDVRTVRALIVGPPDSPYEYGFFEYNVHFPPTYPIQPPRVLALTTDDGQCRFNPNIYADGKVCLSILGTWRGKPGEQWSSAQGLESLLISIQSLLSSHPYENEPGFESTPVDSPRAKEYVAKIRYQTINIAVIKRMEGLVNWRINAAAKEPQTKKPRFSYSQAATASTPKSTVPPTQSPAETDSDGASPSSAADDTATDSDPETAFLMPKNDGWDPFADTLKRRFLWYYETYLTTAERGAAKHRRGTPFMKAEFEHKGNTMDGTFYYTELIDRIKGVKRALDLEQRDWEEQGLQQERDKTSLAAQLRFQFTQLKEKYDSGETRIALNLPVAANPFVWDITFFGKPLTNLDGGVFSIKMHIPPDFPTSQPRLVMSTAIFHHRVSRAGTICYCPVKEEELASHLEALIVALDDEDSKFDPRTNVNPEAFTLRWGTADQRQLYNRFLRRSAERSLEL